jgi:hypothetical protein
MQVIDEPSGGTNIMVMSVVVDPCHCISQVHIPIHAEIVDTREGNQATWARAHPKVPNAGDKNPVIE